MIVTRTRTTKIEILGVSRDPFLHYDDKYRRARERLRRKLNTCIFCRRKFEEGAGIYIVLTDKGNKVGCPKCSKDAYAELGDDNRWKSKETTGKDQG